MTLARRMWLASAVLALLVGAAFTALILAVSAQREATDREARSKDVTVASLQLENVVGDVESNFLNFAFNGSEESLEAYEAASDKLEPQLESLQALVKDDLSQRQTAQEIDTQVREYAFSTLPPLIPLLRPGRGLAQPRRRPVVNVRLALVRRPEGEEVCPHHDVSVPVTVHVPRR